jgi:hypothetical protein
VKQHVEAFAELQTDVQRRFAAEASRYLRIGLDLLHSGDGTACQASVGNLSVSIELMLKAYLASLSLNLLYENLPIDLRVLLADPEAIPDFVRTHKWLRKLRSGAFKTPDFATCVGAWLVCSGDSRIPPKSFLEDVSKLRNASVHGVLHTLASYELNRVGYTAVGLYKTLADLGLDGFADSALEDADMKLFTDFPEERLEQFRRKLLEAQRKAEAVTEPGSAGTFSGWEEYPRECPVCGSEGRLTGSTEEDYVGDGEWRADPVLTFTADAFSCPTCGLELEGFEELEWAEIETVHDISDELADWWDETQPGWRHEPEPDDYR